METPNHTEQQEAFFSPIEARIVASLMEKHLTTPKNYPLTMNSLQLACNQKSNREPVMQLTEGEIGHAVNRLEQRNLIGVDYSGRANHITHRVMTELDIDRHGQAILAVLMVRGPVTLNEIRTRTQRMVEFEDLNHLKENVHQLMDRDKPLLVHIPKSPGSREDRYTHLLCGEIDISTIAASKTTSAAPSTTSNQKASDEINDLQQRVSQLETQVAELLQRIT